MTRVVSLLVAGVPLALILSRAPAARGAEPEWLPSQPFVEGKRVFDDKGCSQCHPTGGEADGRPGPDLARGSGWRDAMQFAGSLWNHTPAMTEKMRDRGIERPTLSPEEIGKLIAYVFSLTFVDEAGDVAHGRELFEKRSCATCHQIGGRGGTAGPRLDELRRYATSLFVAQALWNHGPSMAKKMAELHVERPRLEGDELVDILAFLRGEPGPVAPLEQVAAESGSPRAGRALFASKGCVHCHAIAGAGGHVGPDLGRARHDQRPTDLVAALWNHGPAMWARMRALGVAFPELTERDTSDLLAYLYFVRYADNRGDARRGAVVFREKSCAGCHPGAGDGSGVGPDLAHSEATRSSLHWASAMWNHAPAVHEKTRERALEWPHFEDDDMRDLVSFLRARDGER